MNASALQAQDKIDFSRDILPILSDNCFTCHGPDAATRQGGFRLDIHESAMGEADSGEHPIVPGDVDASEIIRRLISDDDSEVMPPQDETNQPSPEQIELLKRWIEQGADWKEHWAFIAPQRPAPPTINNESWCRNEIDRFVLARLEAGSLSPSQEAAKETLIRRLSLDLIGLPPSLEEVDAFLADDSPNAYEKVVDRLLASPQYGEHMATFWLDAARFADTNGYQNDFRRSMWLWRDWVIDAYNANMPYDQFTVEQLAGDMLPDATLSQKVASGFNRNHRSNTEGGSINEEWLVENVVDRVETTSTVFLGLTMGCARCHDHKFDPISQREFYEFFSFFNNVDEKGVYTEQRGNAGPVVSVPNDEFRSKIAPKEHEIVATKASYLIAIDALKKSQPVWESNLVEVETETSPKPDLSVLSREFENSPDNVATLIENETQGDRFSTEKIGSAYRFDAQNKAPMDEVHLDLGPAFDFDASKGFTVCAWVYPTTYGAIISRMDRADAYRGFDMLITPTGQLNVHSIHDWPKNATKITSELSIAKDKWTHVAVVCRSPGKAKDVSVFFNGSRIPHSVDSDTLDGTTLTDHPVWLGLRKDTPNFEGRITDVRAWKNPLPDEIVANIFQRAFQNLVVSTKRTRTKEEQATIDSLYLNSGSDQKQLIHLNKLELELEQLKKKLLPTTMVMKELDEPRQTYVLNRGLYDQPDKEQPVSAAIPSLFNSNTKPKNRLELAEWLVNGKNPLTARVAMNHFWTRYFGVGLLETPENFGVQSPPPSHPELLDWLATEFVRSDWDMKAMQKLIAMSSTYRQSSAASPKSYAADPKNRLLARGPRFRLPAESIRDNALAISGLLRTTIGGPSIKPYQPEGLWAELAGGAGEPPYEQATDRELYRRSLYIYRKRTVPHPTMTTFDGVGRDVCAVARDRTNTPLQALALLNDVTYVEAAVHLAIHTMRSETDPAERLKFAFRRATSRLPNDNELAVLKAAFEKYSEHFKGNPDDAEELINIGHSKPNPNFNAADLASYASVCSVILNLDEVITKE